MRPKIYRQNGSVVLVVLCFVAVLSISLASYIALSSRAMTLSNRAAQNSLSKQLAEMGLEEALRAFNKNDWNDWTNGTAVDWTLDTTNRRATAVMTFPSGKFSQGITATVKIRVDNYDGAQLTAAWSSSANYLPDNLVGYTDGNWYRSTGNHSGKIPATSSGYWVQENNPIAASMTWVSGSTYVSGSMVNYNGATYRCSAGHTASSANKPPNTSFWISVPYVTYGSDLQYYNESMVFWTNTTWYRYSGGSWYTTGTGMPPKWNWTAFTLYSVGDVVRNGTTWYRCKTAHTSGTTFSATNWDTASTLATTAAAAWAWSSSLTYNLNDATYYGGRWYRSTASSNINNTPSTTSTYWSIYPLFSRSWDSTRQYSQNDTVFYNGVQYLSIYSGANINQNPYTQTNYWRSTAVAAYQWNASTAYSAGVYRSYGGVWYKALFANTGYSPNNTTYWTPATSQSAGVTTGTTVVYAEGTVNIAGSGSTDTQLRAVLAPAPLFPNAVGATSTLTLSGGGTIDSYDSTTAPYSAATAGYAAVLSATGSTSPAITLTSPTVNGYVAAPSASTSPYAPMLTYGGSTVVRGTTTGIGVDLSRVSRSPFVPSADILSVAGGTSLSLVNDTGYTLGTPGATTPTVYNISSASSTPNVALNSSSEVLTIVGPVILNISGNLNVASGSIVIATTGSAEIHLSGRFRVQSSTGGIQNQTSDPKKLIILGTSNLTTHVFQSTTYDFHGVIYLPNGALSIDNSPNIYGAVSANRVTFTGDANVHYDTSLRYATIPGVDQLYTPTEVRELTDATELATMP